MLFHLMPPMVQRATDLVTLHNDAHTGRSIDSDH